jgi:cytochrome c biogenesis protein CcmG, thiol:disulfide interchange protein DsbE
VPETFVIDKAGKVRLKHVGPVTPQVLQEQLLPLLQQLKGEPT